jgi:lipopolysaccharide assembly protein A
MRWVHLIVIVVFAIATIIFAIQNFEIVTVSFLSSGFRVPLAFLVVLIYVLGMITGSSLFGLLYRSIQASRRHLSQTVS